MQINGVRFDDLNPIQKRILLEMEKQNRGGPSTGKTFISILAFFKINMLSSGHKRLNKIETILGLFLFRKLLIMVGILQGLIFINTLIIIK